RPHRRRLPGRRERRRAGALALPLHNRRRRLDGEARPGYVTWLTKSEVNALYYNTVAGDIVFRTEAWVGHHPAAAARLVAARARGVGLRTVRILEVGANDARFARELLRELRVRHEA